jgi:hypothetical protein
LLLWLTGDEDDDEQAIALDSNLDAFLRYEDHYLANPGKSSFPLERRHAEVVLRDTSIPLMLRLDRARELWLDPIFEPPVELISEGIVAADSFDSKALYRYRAYTVEDRQFEAFELFLARCAPDKLAKIRRTILSEPGVPADVRYWRALHAAEPLILVRAEESAAARMLRLSACERDPSNELYASSKLLLVELVRVDAARQLEIVMEADLEDILIDIIGVLKPLTLPESDALVARFRDGSVFQKCNLMVLLAKKILKAGDPTWDWLLEAADSEETNLQASAYRALVSLDPVRFGRHLLARDWSWSSTYHYWVNHYGTEALIASTGTVPFDQVALRLAPWRLLEAARERGEVSDEVRLAAQILSSIIRAEQITSPDPGALVTMDRTESETGPARLSLTPLKLDSELLGKPDEELKAHRRAREVGVERVDQVRAAGGGLYLMNLDSKDLLPALRHAADQVDLWLEGMKEETSDFTRRVILAEGVYIALCEALLSKDPDRGVQLWKVLKKTLKTRFVGRADLDEMVHMVYRAAESQPVNELRLSLVDIDRCNTDKALFELAVAAACNNQGAWLQNVIDQDLASKFSWQRRRGLVLQGFSAGNVLPQDLAWPGGPVLTALANLKWRSARFRYVEACAHHWWRTYLLAKDPETAYAAWVLFARAGDRRAWAWMNTGVQCDKLEDRFYHLKMIHAEVNASFLEGRMGKREDKLEAVFISRVTPNDIAPWRKI